MYINIGTKRYTLLVIAVKLHGNTTQYLLNILYFQMKCPITFRGPNGPAAGVAAQHSQCFASWYGSVPGLKVSVLIPAHTSYLFSPEVRKEVASVF